MDTKSDGQFIIMQGKIEANKQDMKSNKKDSDKKMMKLTEDFKAIFASIITSMTENINISKSSPAQKYSSKPQDPTTVVPANRRDLPLGGGHSKKIGVMWTLKHEISSP